VGLQQQLGVQHHSVWSSVCLSAEPRRISRQAIFCRKRGLPVYCRLRLALALLAPAIHKLTSTTEVVDPEAGGAQGGQNTQSNPVRVTVGFVGGFLTASVFTIWGTLLQSAGELLIVWELRERELCTVR
jgi:hypothetical protein